LDLIQKMNIILRCRGVRVETHTSICLMRCRPSCFVHRWSWQSRTKEFEMPALWSDLSEPLSKSTVGSDFNRFCCIWLQRFSFYVSRDRTYCLRTQISITRLWSDTLLVNLMHKQLIVEMALCVLKYTHWGLVTSDFKCQVLLPVYNQTEYNQ
jgi:hypothetical protein